MKRITTGFAALALLMSGSAAVAASFDGKKSLLCTATEVYECDASHGCRVLGKADAYDVRHLNVDFRKKQVTLDHRDENFQSRIDQVETVDGKLVLQGIEDGAPDEVDGGGWSMSIDNRYGTMVFTMSGGDVAFVGLGGCTPAD